MHSKLTQIILQFLFFFQAEDGIRDVAVTGVQTCALPICDTKRKRLSQNRFADDVGKRRKGCERKNELKQRTVREAERDHKASCAHLFEKRFTSGGKRVIANATPLLSLPARTLIESEPLTDRV